MNSGKNTPTAKGIKQAVRSIQYRNAEAIKLNKES